MNEEKIEYEYYTVDFDGVNSRWTLYETIKKGLDFPDYCGHNLDAIWDCLTDMVYHGVTITLDNFDKMEMYDKNMSEKLLEVFILLRDNVMKKQKMARSIIESYWL